MSKRHQVSRRRSYGRRRHDIEGRPGGRPASSGPEERDDALEGLVARIVAEQLAGRFGPEFAD